MPDHDESELNRESSTAAGQGSTRRRVAEARPDVYGHVPLDALTLREDARRRWHGPGLSRRAERIFNATALFFVFLFAAGWVWSLTSVRTAEARELEGATGVSPAGRAVATALSRPEAPTAAYINDAVQTMRGRSGKLRAHIQEVGVPLPEGADDHLVLLPDGSVAGEAAPRTTQPGLYRVRAMVGEALRPVTNLNVIVMEPFSAKQRGRIGQYLLGSWPEEVGKRGPSRAPAGKYANPKGFIRVTKENQNTQVSEHFQLRHFLTKNQFDVWPKYLVLRPELVDKLELVLSDLQSRGIETKGVKVMSGFRTPSYNAGGGNTGGRASLSRHTYGDASDIYIDNDGDGNMDDLNGDGRVNIEDARVILAAVERVERAHPQLVGGAGVYVACCGHGPFIHIDTRGYPARWVGSGSG